jgi:hypothetical protein
MGSNCWEVKQCGRQPGGENAEKLGVCPAAALEYYNGINGGKNGGRYCWRITGTLCNDQIQGTWAQKIDTCLNCAFCRMVRYEEGKSCKL